MGSKDQKRLYVKGSPEYECLKGYVVVGNVGIFKTRDHQLASISILKDFSVVALTICSDFFRLFSIVDMSEGDKI